MRNLNKKLLIFAFLFYQLLQCVEMQKNKKIIIVGAGLAGYSAGAKLLENGYTNFEILEALDRRGGRIHTIDYGTNGQKIDLGAQWIHGETGNIIWEMVSDYEDLGSTPFDSIDGVYLYSNGSTPNQRTCIKLQGLLDTIIDNSWSEIAVFKGPFGLFFNTKYNKSLTSLTYNTIDKSLTEMMRFDASKQVSGYYGCASWNDLSGKLNYNYGSAAGDQDVTWLDVGFATVFDYISKKLPNSANYLDVDSRIRYKKDVVNIKYSTVDTEKTIVTCADGTTYSADNVIVTVSLGVLKAQHSTLFTPALPARKITAINTCGMGTIGKIFLRFDTPFWPSTNFVSYVFLWTDSDKKAIIGTDKEWLLGVMTFNKVDAFPELLEAFVAGPWITTFEGLTDQKVIDDCMWLLQKFLNKILPKPTYMNRTKWLTHEKFRGAYSFISYASETPIPNTTPADLALAIKKTTGRKFLHFAGEATDSKFPSYAHGAISSGYRAALEV